MYRAAFAASLCLLTSLPDYGHAQGAMSDSGQEVSGSQWFVQIEGGVAEIHEEEDRGAAGAVRLGRYLDKGGISAAILSIAGAATDAAYGTLEVGLQLQLPGRPRITPTIGGRIGVMLEEGSAVEVFEGTAGLAVRIAAEQWIRLTVQAGQHSDAQGPHALLVGYQAPL
jgi:hypothetical protein